MHGFIRFSNGYFMKAIRPTMRYKRKKYSRHTWPPIEYVLAIDPLIIQLLRVECCTKSQTILFHQNSEMDMVCGGKKLIARKANWYPGVMVFFL